MTMTLKPQGGSGGEVGKQGRGREFHVQRSAILVIQLPASLLAKQDRKINE